MNQYLSVKKAATIACMALLEKALAAMRYGGSAQRTKDDRQN